MSSFVVRIPDMGALMLSWRELLSGATGQKYEYNEQVLRTLGEWPRIKWFYYCDDQNGNTIRIYDAEHLRHFGGSHYLNLDGVRKGHYERVIFRGEKMWSGDQAELNIGDSLRNRFRNNPAWQIFGARRAPLRAEMQVPTGVEVRLASTRTADIQAGMLRKVRLWYFEAVNQLPEFNPAEEGDIESFGDLDDLLPDFVSDDEPEA